MVNKPILEVLDGHRKAVPPVWLMRQAGRYLPEYRAVREQAGGFLDLVFSPELAAEVTLQPLRRFGFDAAILFSDILVVPYALGQRVSFAAGEGPQLEPISDRNGFERLSIELDHDALASVYETVARVKDRLDPEVALLGFCGAPWTVATYMVAVNAVGLDWMVDPALARDQVQSRMAVQGNLDPLALVAGGAALDRAVDLVLEAFGGGPFIFNLGHGIVPETPIAHVERMVQRV